MKLSATVFIITCFLTAADKSNSETSRISKDLSTIAQACVPWHNFKTDPTCPANETCVEVVGKSSTYKCAKGATVRSLACACSLLFCLFVLSCAGFVWLFVVHSPVACSFVSLACFFFFFSCASFVSLLVLLFSCRVSTYCLYWPNPNCKHR